MDDKRDWLVNLKLISKHDGYESRCLYVVKACDKSEAVKRSIEKACSIEAGDKYWVYVHDVCRVEVI